MKNNFLLQKDQQEVFETLSDEDAGKLIKGIFKYLNNNNSGLTGVLKAVFIPIKKEIDKNEKKYQQMCEKNKENVKKRWDEKKDIPNDTTVYFGTKKEYESIPNDTDNNHISYINNQDNKKDINRGMGEEEEKEEDTEVIDVSSPMTKSKEKIHFAEFVTMTNEEYNKLILAYGKEFADQCIKKLDDYKGSTGKKYKSDYRTILNWVVDEQKNKNKQFLESSKSFNVCNEKETVNEPYWLNQKQEKDETGLEELKEILEDF